MFRIWIYLNLKSFFKTLLFGSKKKNSEKIIQKEISSQSKKKFVTLYSQCRIAFLFILKFLKTQSSRREIIFCAYNLPEMVNIATNLKLKTRFYDLNYDTGSFNLASLKKKISKKTLAVVITNIFNDYSVSKKIKELCKKNKIILIEDNAIYFDNFAKINKKKIYSGSLGDYSIYSFNIMKNISSFYGGASSTNDKNFIRYYEKEKSKLKKFPVFHMAKQIIIFFILKIMSINFLFKNIFIHIITFAFRTNLNTILKLLYPSSKKLQKGFPSHYLTLPSRLSISLTSSQLKDKLKRQKLFLSRMKKHQYYQKKMSLIKNKNFKLLKIKDKSYQNYLDFPVLVKDKDKLNNFLLQRGIEIRYKHYYNCEKIFHKANDCKNSQLYENDLICLPIHSKIKLSYMDFVIKNIENYYVSTNY